METTDPNPNVGPQQEKMQNTSEHNMYQEFFDAVDEVYSLLQSQNALQIKQLSMLVSKLKELKNIPIPQGQLPELINCVLNYIEIVLTFISSLKDYTRQKELVLYFLYMIPYFFDNPETIREFMKEATVKVLELFMFGNFSIVSNRELLGTFNSIAIKSTKEARTAVAEKTLYYMYKLIDSLSTYGDYGLQADIMETLFRIYGSHIRGKKIKYDLLPGSTKLSQELATNISSDNFDLHVRHWLNKFNENSSLIFTLPCQQLIFGDVTIKNIQEFGPITWLDFDLKEQIVGFYMEGRDSSWNRVIFFARNVSNVNVNRQFTTYNKVTTVTMILSKPCISEAMDSQDYCNSLSKELKIVISNEERDKITKLISHVLPKIFGDVFTHSSSRVSQKLKQVYKPLRMKVSKSVSRRRSITQVENLNVLSRSTTPPSHTAQENISGPEIKYSCLARESIPLTTKCLLNYDKEDVQLAKRSEQNGESCHNSSFVLTEFSRTDVASDRTSLIPSRNSEVFSSRGSSHNATRVQSHEQIQDNIVTSGLALEDDIPLSSTIEIISGHCQGSHSCSLIAENVEFKHSEVFSSSPVKRSTQTSELQLIENIFCSTQFNNGDPKGNKISVFKTSEGIISDKYDTAAENLIQLGLEDVLHYQKIPRFDVAAIESQKETVTIDKKVPEQSDVFPTIANAPLTTPTNDLTEDITSQDLFATTQSCGGSHEFSVNNSKYICGMRTPENKKPGSQTSSEERNFTELSMAVNIGAASDKLLSELAVPANEEGKVQSGEVIEVFIDLTEDELYIEKSVEKPNIESQLKNISVDADVVQNTTDTEILPILNTGGLSDVFRKSSKQEYTDEANNFKENTKTSLFKAPEEVTSDKFETALENLTQLKLEAVPHQEIPRLEVVEIKSQNKTVGTDKKTPKESDVFPIIINVSLVTSVNHDTEGGTNEDLFATTQKCCGSSEISENNSSDIFGMRTQENKKTESQTFLESNVGATSDEPFSKIAAAIDEEVKIQSGEVVQALIDLTVDEPDVEKHLDKPDIEMQLENTDAEGISTLNTQELLSVLGKSSTHESTDKGAMSPKTNEPPPTVIIIDDKSNVPAICVQRKPRRLIKMGEKLFRLDNIATKIKDSEEGPRIEEVNSKIDASTKQTRAAVLNTLEEKQATNSVQKQIDETTVPINSKVVDKNLTKSQNPACVTVMGHLEDVIESVVKNFDPDDFGRESSKQTHKIFQSHVEEIIDNVARNVAESSISVHNETVDYFVRKSPKQTIGDSENDVIARVGINESGCESQKRYEARIILCEENIVEEPAEKDDFNILDDVHSNCYNPPQIETNFTPLRLSPEATHHPTNNSESNFDFLQKTQISQKASQESRMSDLILKKPARRLISNDSMEALLAKGSEDKIYPNCHNSSQIRPTLKQLSIVVNRMVIPHPSEISHSNFDFVQKTYMSEKISSELRKNSFIVKKAARPLASDNSMEALVAEQGSKGQKVEDCSEKSQVLNTSFNTQSRSLKETNFIEHVDCSSIVPVSSTIVTTVASIHYANNEGGSPKETTNLSVIAGHITDNIEEQAPVVISTCNDYDVIETVDDFSKGQRTPIIIRKEVNIRPILSKGVDTKKFPPNKPNSSHIQEANSPILTINKSPEVVLNRLDLKTKKTRENYVETDAGIDEILHLWDKKQDNNNENEFNETAANRRRVLYKEGSFSYLDDMELTTRTTPEMSQTPEPIEVSSKKKKTKRKPQDELLSTKEKTRKHASLRAKKERQSVKPPSLLYDPVASKNLREIFEKACENIFNRTAENFCQKNPINRAFEFGDLDVAVRGVEEFENSYQMPISPAKIMSPKSPQLPELDTPPDLIWPEIETVPQPAINVLQHIVVPSQPPKRPVSVELVHSLESTPPKKIRLDENTLSPSIPVVSNHTSEITDKALSIITYVCTLANQTNEAAFSNLGLIMDFINRLKQ